MLISKETWLCLKSWILMILTPAALHPNSMPRFKAYLDSGKVRLSEINEELKNLRKEVRMTVRIEKHSLEIEERLRKAEEQNQNEKRVEHKEKESQEVR